jgi:hypothetical protein
MLGVECAFRYAVVEHTELNREMIIIKWKQLKQEKGQILAYSSYF